MIVCFFPSLLHELYVHRFLQHRQLIVFATPLAVYCRYVRAFAKYPLKGIGLTEQHKLENNYAGLYKAVSVTPSIYKDEVSSTRAIHDDTRGAHHNISVRFPFPGRLFGRLSQPCPRGGYVDGLIACTCRRVHWGYLSPSTCRSNPGVLSMSLRT